MSQADARSIPAAHAVEAYNYGCVVDNDRGEGFLILEHLLNQGSRLNLIAADDAHFCVFRDDPAVDSDSIRHPIPILSGM